MPATATIKINGAYDGCKNKNQLGLAIWEQHEGKLTPKEVVEIARQARPDIAGFVISDAYNGQTNWRKKHNIAAPNTKAKRTPATTTATTRTAKPASVSFVYEEAFRFVEKSNGIDNAIAILEQLKKLKGVL